MVRLWCVAHNAVFCVDLDQRRATGLTQTGPKPSLKLWSSNPSGYATVRPLSVSEGSIRKGGAKKPSDVSRSMIFVLSRITRPISAVRAARSRREGTAKSNSLYLRPSSANVLMSLVAQAASAVEPELLLLDLLSRSGRVRVS